LSDPKSKWSKFELINGEELTKAQLRQLVDIQAHAIELNEKKLKAEISYAGQLRADLIAIKHEPTMLMDSALAVEQAIERTQNECNRRIQFFTRDLSTLECVQ
jgi:hypothetical protein